MITGVARVLLDVDDQDEAKAFWVDTVGFELAYDETVGGERWVEVRPQSGSPLLVLVPRTPDDRRPAGGGGMPHANVLFTCDDLQQTYEDLTGRGVAFPNPPTPQHFGWWAVFEDPGGTRYALSVTARDGADPDTSPKQSPA